MKILIDYSSKWSASFADPITYENKVPSLDKLKDNSMSEVKDVYLNENDTYETTMRKIGDVYQNFSYKSVDKNTVLGILSRLLGEVRYLDKVREEEDHIINRLSEKVSFNLHDREMYNEIVSLAKPMTKVQSNGGGLISKSKSDFLLLDNNFYSSLLFSVFNLKTLNDIDAFIGFFENTPEKDEVSGFLEITGFAYKEKVEIYQFVKNHVSHSSVFSDIDKRYVKYKKYIALKNEGVDVEEGKQVDFDDELSYYVSLLNRIAIYSGKNIDSEGNFNAYSLLGPSNSKNDAAVLNITGLLYYFLISWVKKSGNEEEIKEVLINKNGNIAGVATNSGKMTIKDLYGSVSPRKMSWSLPYMFDTKFLKKKEAIQFNQSNTKLGLGKESGTLEIVINVSEDEAIALKEQIDAAAVATFHVGKKGLAYVKEIITDE